MQKLLGDLEKLDQESAKATAPADQARYTERRADILEQIAAAAKTADDRGTWLRQAADTIFAAVEAGAYPDGVNRLQALYEKLRKNDDDKNLAAYAKFRLLAAGYIQSMQAPKADAAKIQADWMKTLEQFVADYPTAPDAAEAMLQLGNSQEFTGQDDDAKKWYSRVAQEFPKSAAAEKAAGANPLGIGGQNDHAYGPKPGGQQR